MKGVFVGKTEDSDEFVALAPAGAHTYRTVRRIPEEQRHAIACLELCAGLPWDTKEGSTKAQPAAVQSKPQAVAVPNVDHEREEIPSIPSETVGFELRDLMPSPAPASPLPNREQMKCAAETGAADETRKKPKPAIDKLHTDSMPPATAPGQAASTGPQPERFDISASRATESDNCATSPARSRSRSPRDAPGEADPHAGGAAVDQTVSAIKETLLNQFVECGDPTSGNSMCDVVDFFGHLSHTRRAVRCAFAGNKEI